ncbi:MAG: prolipoprotein diacylglyceryl transferase family protein [Bacteroidales bacterium]|jgi:prolipoprotein diacylglyceryl transferase
MYPTISDLIKDIFGVNIPLPIQSFGFFMAIAFIVAAWLVMRELKRKESNAILSIQKRKVLVGKPATAQELVIIAIVGFIIGYKLLGMIIHYSSFVENPQTFVFSSVGNIIGGIIGAAIAAYFRYWEKNKHKLETPKWEEIDLHPYELTGNIIMLGALFGVIGAKVFDCLENIDSFISDPLGSLFSLSGLTFYGGLIFAAISIIWYAKKNNIPPLVICDVAAPAIMIAYAIGRIGCQTAGDGDWGIVNTLAKPHWLSFMPNWVWAFNYPHNVINEGVAIPGCVGRHCFMLNPPVFPTPFYETIMCAILFIALWAIRKRIKTTGMLFAIFLIMNGVERFFIEKIRVNIKYHIFGYNITQAEIISTLLFFAGILLLIYLLRKKNKIPIATT